MLDDFDPKVLVDCAVWSSIIVLGVIFYRLFGSKPMDLEAHLRELYDTYRYGAPCRIDVSKSGVVLEVGGKKFVVKGDTATPLPPKDESQR